MATVDVIVATIRKHRYTLGEAQRLFGNMISDEDIRSAVALPPVKIHRPATRQAWEIMSNPERIAYCEAAIRERSETFTAVANVLHTNAQRVRMFCMKHSIQHRTSKPR